MKIHISGTIRGNKTYIEQQLRMLNKVGLNNLLLIKNASLPISINQLKEIINKTLNIDDFNSESKDTSHTQARSLFIHYAQKIGLGIKEICKITNKQRSSIYYYTEKFEGDIQFDKQFIRKYEEVEEEINKLLKLDTDEKKK